MRRALVLASLFVTSLASLAIAAPPARKTGPSDAGALGASVPDASVPDAGASDASAPAPAPAQKVNGCVETVPKGADRPFVHEMFPAVGTSGWAATFAVTVNHGKGERVLPNGIDLNGAQEMRTLMKEAGFGIPDQTGTAASRLYTDGDESKATTHLDLAVVLLPPKPGNHTLTLPALPIAIVRANGERLTVCTKTHTILVDDPLQNVPEAKPKLNPEARPQREEWTSLKHALEYGGIGLLAGGLLAYAGWRFAKRPKPVPPPPPPRPPWEVALERLDEIRHAGLLDAQRYAEYFDRTSDAVRGYLGARFAYDGLESTTDEALAALLRNGGGFIRYDSGGQHQSGIPLPGIPLEEIAGFLRECDLVKFANLVPTPDQCVASLATGERIVRATMPVASIPPPPPSSTRPVP